MKTIEAPISVGELVDKLTILDIKLKMLPEKEVCKIANVTAERQKLQKIYIARCWGLEDLRKELYEVNLGLWKIEDQIRECERNQNFGPVFIRLARDVYITNDKRFEIKNQINKMMRSTIMEVKSYESYS